jgi:hypothetical protein
MEQCQHNFIYGESDYFCKKCGCRPMTSAPITNVVDTAAGIVPESVTETHKTTQNKSEFIISVIMGLSVSLSIGLAGIILGLLYR